MFKSTLPQSKQRTEMSANFFRIILSVGVLILFFCNCDGTCQLCSYTNQTTTHSKCSEMCGGGERYYFQYVCCANFTKTECERECNINLTLTKSLQMFESCNKNCSKGGTYNDTTKRCDCPEGTGGRCCHQCKCSFCYQCNASSLL